MTNIDFAYINYEHGGATQANYRGSPGPFSFDGLIRILGQDGRWPDLFVMGEAERWEFDGSAGAKEAAVALNEASGRAYAVELGTLPREWGPIGPAVFYNVQKINAHRWYSGREPDFYARNRNLLVGSLRGRPDDKFHVVGWHGDIHDGDMRLADAKVFRRYANPETPCVIMADWNHTLSGPEWEPRDLNDPTVYDKPWRRAGRILWEHGPAQADPVKPDTRALDFLCGWWDEQRGERVGGIGLFHVAELAADPTPTNFPAANGRQCTTIDGAVVNLPWANALVEGSYRVHDPVDADNPDSDHKRISFTLDI